MKVGEKLVSKISPHQGFIGKDCFKSIRAPTGLQVPERA